MQNLNTLLFTTECSVLILSVRLRTQALHLSSPYLSQRFIMALTHLSKVLRTILHISNTSPGFPVFFVRSTTPIHSHFCATWTFVGLLRCSTLPPSCEVVGVVDKNFMSTTSDHSPQSVEWEQEVVERELPKWIPFMFRVIKGGRYSRRDASHDPVGGLCSRMDV